MISAADEHDESELASLLFSPGFSTRQRATETSGRGVGLDVVKSQVDALGGSVRIASRRGHGTRFEVRVPVNVALTRALIVSDNDQLFALPHAAVEAVLGVEGHDLETIHTRRHLRFREPVDPGRRARRRAGVAGDHGLRRRPPRARRTSRGSAHRAPRRCLARRYRGRDQAARRARRVPGRDRRLHHRRRRCRPRAVAIRARDPRARRGAPDPTRRARLVRAGRPTGLARRGFDDHAHDDRAAAAHVSDIRSPRPRTACARCTR